MYSESNREGSIVAIDYKLNYRKLRKECTRSKLPRANKRKVYLVNIRRLGIE